jgi:hypothetical protein
MADMGIPRYRDHPTVRRIVSAYEASRKGVLGKLRFVAVVAVWGLGLLIRIASYFQFLTLSFGKWAEEEEALEAFWVPWIAPIPDPDHADHRPSPRDRFLRLSRIFATLDRAGLVAVVVMAALPNFRAFTLGLGIAGLVSLVLVFILRGHFTAVVRDPEERAASRVEPLRVENSHDSPMYVHVVGGLSQRETLQQSPIKVDSSFFSPVYVKVVP